MRVRTRWAYAHSQAGPSGPLTAYAIGTFAGGNRSDSPNLAGFNYFLTVPSFDTRTYGRVEGGLTVQFDPNFSTTLNAASTFARDEGNDYRISAGLYYRF